MEQIWKAEIYIQKNSRWFAKHRLKKLGARQHANGCWTIEAEDRTYIARVCDRYRLKYNWYRKEWTRSANYRELFFRHNAPPYRCRYCHRRLKARKVEVDHLVPVAKARSSRLVQIGLRLQGIRNVNDVRNLVPSCHRCNSRKRDQTGIWYLRGVLGSFRIYWVIRGMIRLALAACLLFLAWHYRTVFL